MENTKHGKRREGRWTPIRAKAQDTKANPNSWKTHLVRKRWDIGLLRALRLRIMMMMMTQLYLLRRCKAYRCASSIGRLIGHLITSGQSFIRADIIDCSICQIIDLNFRHLWEILLLHVFEPEHERKSCIEDNEIHGRASCK